MNLKLDDNQVEILRGLIAEMIEKDYPYYSQLHPVYAQLVDYEYQVEE